MRRRQLVQAVAVTIAVGAAMLGGQAWVRHRALARGTTLVYEVADAYDPGSSREQVVQRTAQVLRDRVDKLLPMGRVEVAGTRLTVQVAETDAPALARIDRILSRSARLEFRLVDDASPVVQALVP